MGRQSRWGNSVSKGSGAARGWAYAGSREGLAWLGHRVLEEEWRQGGTGGSSREHRALSEIGVHFTLSTVRVPLLIDHKMKPMTEGHLATLSYSLNACWPGTCRGLVA